MMWWTVTPSDARQRRTVVLDVATAPAWMAMVIPSCSSAGSARLSSVTRIRHPPLGARTGRGDVATEAHEHACPGPGDVVRGRGREIRGETLARGPEVELHALPKPHRPARPVEGHAVPAGDGRDAELDGPVGRGRQEVEVGVVADRPQRTSDGRVDGAVRTAGRVERARDRTARGAATRA